MAPPSPIDFPCVIETPVKVVVEAPSRYSTDPAAARESIKILFVKES